MSLTPLKPVLDAEYLLTRAETEVRLADEAMSVASADAHRVLACEYLGKLFDDGASPAIESIANRTRKERIVALLAAIGRMSAAIEPAAALPPDPGMEALLRQLDDVGLRPSSPADEPVSD